MKNLLLILAIFLFMISCDQPTRLEGKIYIAEIQQTCKDGVGSLFISRILKFNKNTATSFYKVVASVSPERKKSYEHMYENLTKTYKWRISKDILIIENGKELVEFKIQKSKLTGYDNDWKKAIEFTEQVK